MSALHSFPSSPVGSNDDHSHFFANSDDDADTASQRSISLSSGPSSPKPTDTHFPPSSPTAKTPMVTSFSQQLSSPTKSPKSPKVSLDNTPPKEHTTAHEASEPDHETNSIAGTRTSGPPSAVASFKFDNDSTRPSSMSSRTSFQDHDEDTLTHKHDFVASPAVETTYPPPPLVMPSGFGYMADHRATDQESVLSAASSTGTGGRKTRPESKLIEPPEGPLVLGIALVDFNHIVGPRVEFFEGSIFEDEELVRILPFLALPDGAHLSSEDYSYFHMVPSGPKPTTVFGISCNRQIAASELLSKGEDVTRATVQKAVVVLAAKPLFGAVRDKLGVVTNAYFNQRDFRETSILTDFMSTLETSLRSQLTESGLYMGTSIRELVHTFRHRTLILLKALMLQKKIMFYGHPVERLCTYQYSLVSLIPSLLQTLEDCGSPPLAARAPTLSRPTSLRTSDHKSMLAFVGLPLDIFGKDAFFQPYLPLQQVDIAKETSSWLCGCTNSMVYSQSDYDLLVNIETNTFEFKDAKLEKLVSLTPPDRKWIDDLVKDVNDGWNEDDPTRPARMQFKGSDDYLRTKFDEYVSAALSTVKYSGFLAKGDSKGVLITEGYGADSASQQDFFPAWIAAFKQTHAFETWERITDPMLFDIIEPRHPCIDKPTAVADIGLRLSESVRELKLEQQLAPTREAISTAFTTGSTNFFKAVDGLKGRWPVSRTPSNTSVHSTSTSTSNASTPIAETAKSPTAVDSASTNGATPSEPSAPSTPVKETTARPPSVVAAQVTSEAKATIGAWGSSVGSFFSSRAPRFSLSRQSTSSLASSMSPVAPEKSAKSPEQPSKMSAESQGTVAPRISEEPARLSDATDDRGGTVVLGEAA